MEKNRRSNAELEQESGPLANFIRERRKRLGYTQEELAGRIGVGVRFLRELERGETHLRFDKIIQVLDFLGAELLPAVKNRN